MSSSLEGSKKGGLGGYRFLSRFKSYVAPEVHLAECLPPHASSLRVLILHAPRARADFQKLEADLHAEAQSQPSVTHPSVSSIVDFFESKEGLYLVLEHVVGSDLFTVNAFLASKASALSCELTAYIMMQALNGLHHMHTCPRADGSALGDVVHGLAPERILLANTGEVKVSNASLARVLARPEHQTQAFDGYSYRPVEWIAGEPETTASNVYTVGVIMFELLMGRPCFVGKTTEDVLNQVTTRGVRTKELSGNGVPGPLCSIIERATRHVPEQRYTSASEMSQSLADWLASTTTQDMKAALIRFLHEHGLKGTRDVPEEVPTADLPATPEPKEPEKQAENELEIPFGLRKPARRTITKVGLRK